MHWKNRQMSVDKDHIVNNEFDSRNAVKTSRKKFFYQLLAGITFI